MSLSFVASAVQTATADGGFEETKIESKQADAVNKRNAHKPLFEQLRDNQEEDQAKQDEMQREMMRGTRALDEDDVAHLDALERQRQEKERAVQERTQEELALFRAARAERQQAALENTLEPTETTGNEKNNIPLASENTKPPLSGPSSSANAFPLIVVKRKKRRRDDTSKETETEKLLVSKPNEQKDEETLECQMATSKAATTKTVTKSGLGGLLCGYGSSDEEDSN